MVSGAESEVGDDLEDPRSPEDKHIMAMVNPNATEADALRRLNGDADMGVGDYDPYSFFLRMDWDDAETCHHFAMLQEQCGLEPDPDEQDTEEPIPLFHVGEAAYKPMSAPLGFVDGDGRESNREVIVDSGAAQCTISLQTLREWLPTTATQLVKSSKRFLDASGRVMPALGTVVVCMRLGECLVRCTVYVFERLGVPFLLGTNALRENGLVIHG